MPITTTPGWVMNNSLPNGQYFSHLWQSKDSDGKFTGYIPLKEMEITYSRSSGPGGQNVNRIDTKVDLRFHVQSASWISDVVKQRLGDKVKMPSSLNAHSRFISSSLIFFSFALYAV